MKPMVTCTKAFLHTLCPRVLDQLVGNLIMVFPFIFLVGRYFDNGVPIYILWGDNLL